MIAVGIDDTDSPRGGCTTYVAYRLARAVLERWGPSAFADFPRLVRLNPHVPFKTRGNAAVALVLDLPEEEADEVWDLAVSTVAELARAEGKTSPGVAMAVGSVPERARILYRMAVSQLVSSSAAERAGLRLWGGRGRIGAVAAVGADLSESTFELLAYREGPRTPITREAAALVDALTFPFTFHNLDGGRVLLQPRGPDPVLYGVRGLTPQHLLLAREVLLAHGVRDAGWAIFRTNQVTDAHLRGVLYDVPLPYSVYRARGFVEEVERTGEGHVVGRLHTGLRFVAYRHLGPPASALGRCLGCLVELVGGLRPRRGSLYLYVERAYVHGRYVKLRPRCPRCGGSMESAGKGKGLRCRACGLRMLSPQYRWVLEVEGAGLYLPRPGEGGHLLRPPWLDTALPSLFKPAIWIG